MQKLAGTYWTACTVFMPPKKYSQFTCVHKKTSNRAELIRVAAPDIKIEFAPTFPQETLSAVHAFFFDKSTKSKASSQLRWSSISWPGDVGTRSLKTGLNVLCRCAGRWETVVFFDNKIRPDQARKRLYDKLTQKTVSLLPQQAVLRDEFCNFDWRSQQRRKSYLLYWTMGSGKTRGSLAALTAAQHNSRDKRWSQVLIICSNTLIGSWVKTIKESPQQTGYTKFLILGYNEFRNSFRDAELYEQPDISQYIVIVDEAHYYRNLTPMMVEDVKLLRRAMFLMLLTGTPLQNEPDEICPLLALKKCCEQADDDNDIIDCNAAMLGKKRSAIEKKLLQQKSVFYYDPAVYDAARYAQNYPATRERVERVAMSAPQALEYIMSLRAKTKIGPYTIQTARCNSYDSLTRAVSNVIDPAEPRKSPKLCQVVRNVLSGKWPEPHVIFSHYRDRGVHAVDQLLDAEARKRGKSLKKSIISGSTEGRERDNIVQSYNNGKLQILSITDAAKEGVDLHGTGTMHILESAQNLHGENQTMSRVARFGSHSKLPTRAQNVTFIKYHSVFPSVSAMEKQRADLEQYFEATYTLPARGQFDIVAELAQLFKQLENGKTVDERYAQNNLEKAKLLVPWLNTLKRVGDRRSQVAATARSEDKQSSAVSTVAGKRKRQTQKLSIQQMDTLRSAISISKANNFKKRKMN